MNSTLLDALMNPDSTIKAPALTELVTTADTAEVPAEPAKVPTDKLAATIARLTAQHNDAQNEVDALRIKHESLLVQRAMEDQTLDDALVALSKRDAEAARDKADALTAALATAWAQMRAREAAAHLADQAAAWQHAVDLAASRVQHMAKLEKSLATFAADYLEALRLNEELVAALPKNPDSQAAVTDRVTLETAMRKELCRRGLSFAFTWPYGVVNLPEFMPQFEGGLHVISQWAEARK